jgi:general secretion pathway protein I
VQLAESLIAQAGVVAPLQPGETSGVEQKKYQWLMSVTPHTLGFSNANATTADVGEMSVTLFKVRVAVGWGDDERQFEITKLKLATTE